MEAQPTSSMVVIVGVPDAYKIEWKGDGKCVLFFFAHRGRIVAWPALIASSPQ